MSIDDIIIHARSRFRRMRRAGAAGLGFGLGAVVALAGSAILPEPSSPAPTEDSSPVVNAEVVARALATRAPDHPTMSDEIEHFRVRLASRNGEEAFSQRRLVSAHLLRFRAYGSAEDLDAARRYIGELLGTRKMTPDLFSLSSSFSLLVHDFPGALEAARAANEATRDYSSPLRLRLFDALWAAGEYETAAGLLDLPHDRTTFAFLVRKARVLDRQGDPAAARDQLAEALDEARSYAEPAAIVAWALTELGHFENHSGHPERARERYLAAIRTLPGYPGAIEGLADLAWGVDRDPAVAHALFAHALESGGHLDLYLDLAETAREMSLPERAEATEREFLDRATRTSEETRQYLRPLALLLADRYPERIDEALRYAERDLEMRPTSESWATLAWVRYRTGDLEAAQDAARRATAWGVPEPSVRYRAGVVADEAGDRERAVELLTDARAGASELPRAVLRDIEARLARDAG